MIYVGRLDTNKNILPILQQLELYGDKVKCFTIVGDGKLLNEVKNIANYNPKVLVKGRLDNGNARKIMATHDYLILPSLYDGWGAVVNEALTQGTRVLCSEACGASILLDGKWRGEAFSQHDAIETIKKWIDKGPVSSEERKKISLWAKHHISGALAAQYFLKTMNNEQVTAPWLS